MATEADIPPPVCETRTEQGFHIADQATNISNNKLPQEEKNRADTHNEPATVAEEDFLPTPSIDQVHCEVNKMSSDATEKDETVISLVTSPELDDQSLQSAVNAVDPYEMIQHKDEKSNVSDKDVRVEPELSKNTTHGETTEGDISGNLATSDESKEVECEHNKIPPERNFADSLEIAAEKENQEPKVTETDEESPLVQVVDDEQFEKESEKLPLADLSADGNEPTFIDKVIDEEGPTKPQWFETEENITTLPVDSLHEVPKIIEASDLSQENKTTSSSEEYSTNANQHVIASDDPEEKTIDAVEEHKEVFESFPTIVSSSSKEESITAESECVDEETIDKVDTQKEILEEFPTVVQNEEIEENLNKVDGSDTKNEETLEKGSEEMSLPLPLAREANVDEPMVMHEAGVEHGELRKTELCESESTESIEKPEDSLNVVSEDIKESDPDQEIETRSHTEEQIEAAQPQADLDEKTDDKILDVAETKEEILEKTEQGFHIADQATNPADIHNEPCTVEGEDFLTTPSIDQVHCEVNETSSDPTEQPDQTEKDETVIPLLRSPELDDRSLQSAADAVDSYEKFQQTAEKSNVSEKDVRVETELSKDTTHGETTEDDISGNLTASDESKEVECELNKMPPEGEVLSHERNFADSLEIGAESASQDNSSSVEAITNTTSGDEFQGKNNLDSSFCEDDTTKAELFETEENITTLLKEDVDTEKPVEFLHEVPEITEASDLSQENKATSSPEEDSTTANQHVIASDDTEEKTIDAVEEHKEVLESFPIIVSSSPKEESITAESECMDEKAVDKVDTQKEILESLFLLQDFSAVVPNEEIEENLNKVDGSDTKDEETLEKESDEMSLPLPSAREANDDESIIKPEDSLNVVSEDIKESDLDREIETRSYTEEQIEAAQPQAAMDEKTDDKTLDAAETKEEILENMPTCVLDEKTEGESSLVQDDSTKVKNEDHLEKDSEEASNDDVITKTDEVKVEVEYPSRTELFQEEKNIEHDLGQHTETTDGVDVNEKTPELQSVEINVSTEDNDRELEKGIVTPSLEEASTKEAPEESTESTLLKEEHLQDHEAPASSDDIEINHTLEDQSLTAIPHAITSERTIDPTDTKAVCLEVQNVATEIPHMESEAHLGKESEKSSLTEETNETESKNLSEPKEDKDLVEAELSEKENNSAITLVTEKTEDIMESDFGEKTANPQEISSDKPEEETIDAVEREEEILHVQGIAASIPDADREDKSSIEEDCSQHPSSNETSSGQANDDEAAITGEANFVDESLIKAESFESEKNAEVTLVKEEVSIESLQVADNDIKDSAVEQDREISFKEYTTKEECHEEMVEHLEKDSDSTSLAEAPIMDTIESTEEIGESGSGQSTETTSTEEQILTEDTQEISCDKTEEKSDDAAYTKGNTIDVQDTETNEDSSPIEEDCSERPSTTMHEAKLADQNLIKTALFENEESTEGNLAKEELSTRSLEVSDEDTKASASDQERQTSSIEEQGLTTSTLGIIDDQKQDKTIDAAETPEDKNVATTTLHQEIEENSLIQVDCQKDDPEKESENTSQIGETTESTLKDDAEVEKAADSIEVVNEDTNDNCEESTIIHESEVADQGLLKAELFENEKNTEGNLAHEEVFVRSLEVSDEDVKASGSGKDREISSIEEDNTIDATETPEDKNVATTLHEETEKNSPIQVDCQKEHSEKESEITPPTGETTESTLKDDAVVEKAVDSFEVVNEDINESKLADQNLIKAELFENEENTEGNSAKDEVSIRSLEVLDEDIKVTASGQDRETCSIEEQGLTTSPSGIIDDQKEDKTIDATESPEDKNVATTTLHEETEENSPIQVDCQKEDLEKESEDTSQTGETTETTLKDDAVVAKAADSFEVVNEDIKAPAFVFTGNDNDEEPTIIHEPKLADQNLIKAELFENEESTEGDLAKEEVSVRSLEVSDEDIKASASGQDREICSLEEQGPTTSPSGIIDDQKEDKAVDATESLEDKNVATTTLHDETEKNSLIQVDCQKEYLENETENTSQTGETTESTLKDNTEEQIQAGDLQEISCAKEEEKTFDATYTEGQTLEVRDVETDVQREQNEDNSPSSIEVETPTAEAQETLSDEINEKTTDVTDAKEDCLEVQDITTNASNGDDEDNSPTEADSSQNPSLEEAPTGNAEDHESIIMHQAKFVDENLIKANLFENEKTAESTLIKEETKSLQFADGDIKAPASCEDREISSLEEQSLIADPTGNIAEEKEDETIDPTDLSDETSKDKVPKEIDAVETKAVITELNEEEIYLRDLHMTNAVDIAAHEENASSSDAVKIPSTNGSDEVSEEHILENQREIQQDAETEEAHKQDEDLHVSAPCQDSSMEKIDKDVQLCLASTNDSDVTEEVLPARDDNITEKTDIKESEVLKDDQKPNAGEPEETECGQILLDETVEETKELVSIPVANDAPIMSFTETSEVGHFTSERELTIDREELQTEKTATADDKETKNDEDKGEEIGVAHEQKISDFSSAATNVIEARDQDVAGFLSESPEKNGVAPEEKKSEHESKDQVLEFEKGEREYAFIGNVMVIDETSESSVIGVAPEEKESEYESKNQVLESIAQVQSCDIIPKGTDMKTEEENTETAAEMKSENVLAEDIFEPKITPYEKESMKVDISSEKGDEDLEDYHLGSCKEEVITERCLESEVKQEEINTEEIFEVVTDGNETEKVSEVSEETDDKAVEHPETILLANESINHQKELGKSGDEVTAILDTEEVKSSNMAVLENEEKRIGAADKEMAKDEVLLNQNSNTSVIDETAVELPKALDENIICEAPPTKTVHETIEEFEGKNEDANTKHESLPLPEFTQGKESEKQDQKYEICTPEEQADDEENFTAGKGKEEAEGADTCTQDIPVHNESSTTKNEYFEEKYPNKSTETQISSATGDTELIEQVIKDEGVDSRQVEEVSDECKQIKETSTLVEPATIPTSEIMQEYMVETSPETKDQRKEVDDLPQESNVSDAELKMAQKDGPPDLQTARDISENVQELNEGSVELSKKENPVEVYPSENIEAKVSSEEQKTEKIQKVLVPETLDQEIEEHQPGSTSKAVLKVCEEEKIIEKVSELQSSMEDTAQSDKKEETERQIDSLPVLPHVKCSDIETEEKDLPLRSDVAELEVVPLPSNDKHVVLEPSKCEPEEANSGHKEGTSQTTTESKEMDTPSLMDLLQTPTKKTSEMASRSEDMQAGKNDEGVCEDAKTDEEKDDEEESSEQRRPDLGSEAPVMVDMGDADLKTPHKKSHNILSGVGSKVKHSIAKVKKAITGKSSHPKPPSPK
ncbi:hypothetical protein ABFX02_08G008200 [Erythranthe guttata]